MSKLKTLKDIESVGTVIGIANYYEDIRKEAIKWIDKERTLRMNANDFILVFFDITEEDLK